MNVYQIALPDSAPNAARAQWASRALAAAGGYTYLGERYGAWMSDEGKLFEETMHWYNVVTTRQIWDGLVSYAFQLFPNEQALYTAIVGDAEIIERPKISGGE